MPSKSKSVSRSRPGLSRRGTSQHSVPYLPNGPEDLIMPSGMVGEETVDLLHDFVHPGHHHADDTLVEDDDEASEEDPDAVQRARMAQRPWWKRPTPWWFLCMSPLSTIAAGATIAPRIEILTMLVCDHLKPEYTAGRGMEDLGIHTPSWGPGSSDSLSNQRILSSLALPTNSTPATAYEPGFFHIAMDGTLPPNPKLCKGDPVVAAGFAKLQGTMTTAMGVLGVLTVGFWGALSDRAGRTRIVGVTILGRILEDFIFIFVALFSKRLPGGYWFLVIGPVVEGALGGISAASAAIHAYISDCTTPADRSRWFSLMLGTFFIGMALGPTLGGLLIAWTGNILSVYYLATIVHVAYAVVNWTVLPESLSPAQMEKARRKYEEALEIGKHARQGKPWLNSTISRLTAFARPLAIFIPRRVERAGSPGKVARRDWSLTLVAAAQACITMIFGGITYKFQFAQMRFAWTSLQMGYWLTSVGVARALHLAVILPLAIHWLKPKQQPIQLPVENQEPIAGSSDASAQSAVAPSSAGHVPHHNTSLRFDLGLARVSLLIDFISYMSLAVAPTGLIYLIAGVLSSFGGGFGPAVQSIALELYARSSGTGAAAAGTLFGALSVLTALVGQVIGPAIYGLVYFSTVRVFPAMIFVVSCVLVLLSFILLSCVRLPGDGDEEEGDAAGIDEAVLAREPTVVAEDPVRKAATFPAA